MSAATAQQIDLPEEQLERLFSSLTKHEREHFALALFDIIRQDVVDLEEMKSLFANWSMTAMVRHHPHFEQQVKEYKGLIASGELFEGTDVDANLIAELQDTLH